jgi:hypothetical protein
MKHIYTHCPICNNELQIYKYINHYNLVLEKKASYIVRIHSCDEHMYYQIISLYEDVWCNVISTPNNCVIFNYIKKNTTFIYINPTHKIVIPKILNPDYPKLDNLNLKMKAYLILE